MEHVRPRSKGGSNAFNNLALSCQGCNCHKHDATTAIDPFTGRRVALFNPRRHRREVHFGWSDDTLLMMGLTPIGRATIARLHLNRRGVVNIRRMMRLIGRHPPRIL